MNGRPLVRRPAIIPAPKLEGFKWPHSQRPKTRTFQSTRPFIQPAVAECGRRTRRDPPWGRRGTAKDVGGEGSGARRRENPAHIDGMHDVTFVRKLTDSNRPALPQVLLLLCGLVPPLPYSYHLN